MFKHIAPNGDNAVIRFNIGNIFRRFLNIFAVNNLFRVYVNREAVKQSVLNIFLLFGLLLRSFGIAFGIGFFYFLFDIIVFRFGKFHLCGNSEKLGNHIFDIGVYLLSKQNFGAAFF